MNKIAAPKYSRPGRRRVSVSLAESKTLRLYQEGVHLLARADFEQISMARLAKDAGISVGAFYVRFSDKNAFLDFVTVHAFLSAQQRFQRARALVASRSRSAEALADTLVAEFASQEFAGIVRMAAKRGFSIMMHRNAFDLYRSFVVDQVSEMLPDSSDTAQKTELAVAMQASFGILTDAVISQAPTEPLRLSEYRDIIVKLLTAPIGKAKLREPKRANVPAQNQTTKI